VAEILIYISGVRFWNDIFFFPWSNSP